MRTGGFKKAPGPFQISFLAIDGILKRLGFKDAVCFKGHNPICNFDSYLFGNSICFNLFSEYGVGNQLKPLLEELLKNGNIDPKPENLFFREMIKLAPEINNALLGDDFSKKIWGYDYAIVSLNKSDEISKERLERLRPLFEEKDEMQENIRYDEESNTLDVQKTCSCKFCEEFRKFPKGDKNIEDIIKSIIKEILRDDIY